MALIQTDIPEQLNIKLKIYKAKWQQPTLGHAVVHILERFFNKFDDDWILKANDEIQEGNTVMDKIAKKVAGSENSEVVKKRGRKR